MLPLGIGECQIAMPQERPANISAFGRVGIGRHEGEDIISNTKSFSLIVGVGAQPIGHGDLLCGWNVQE